MPTKSTEDTEEILRTARTRRDKAVQFIGDDEDGVRIEWYAAYRGKFGWSACRSDGEWMYEPSEAEVEDAADVYDHVELVDLSETPEAVTL